MRRVMGYGLARARSATLSTFICQKGTQRFASKASNAVFTVDPASYSLNSLAKYMRASAALHGRLELVSQCSKPDSVRRLCMERPPRLSPDLMTCHRQW